MLAQMIAKTEFRDPDLAGQPITVTEVSVSPDLRNATVFVTPLTGDADAIIPALQRAAGFMRSELAASVKLRYMPSLTFEYDRRFDQAEHIDKLLRQPEVERDLADSDGADDTRDSHGA